MKKHIPLSFFFSFFFLFFFSGNGLAEWNNFVVNFSKNLYGKGNQTWNIFQYDESWVYFANKNGMLQFDGNSWSTYTLSNTKEDVRSVCPSAKHKKIFVGGVNEFGYFEPKKDGELMYVCLSDSLSETDRSIGNVWGIHENENIVYFQGDVKILKYLDNNFSIIDSKQKIDCSKIVNGVLYIGTDDGVWILVGNTFIPLHGGEALKSKRIKGIIPYKSGIIIATAYDGLFYHDGQTTQAFHTGEESFLRQNEIFCITSFENQIAIGTVHKGIILIDLTNLNVKYFNENNGLQNNTVLSLAFDKSGNLWAGLDNGIDYVCLSSYLTNLYSQTFSIGTGYTALLSDNILYLGTNRGLYYTSYPVKHLGNHPDIRSVSNSSGQVWNLRKINNEIFCLHDRGIFLVKDNTLENIASFSGAWTCQLITGRTDEMFVGMYSGLYVLKKEGGKWTVTHRIAESVESVRSFEQETENILWMPEKDKIVRIELNENLTRIVKSRKYGKNNGLPDDKEFFVTKLNGRVFFSTSNGIYQYNEKQDRMEPSHTMNNIMCERTSYKYLRKTNEQFIGLSDNNLDISDVSNYKKGINARSFPINRLFIEFVKGYENLISLSDSLIMIPNENGFALFKTPALERQSSFNPSVRVKRVYISYPKDSLLYKDNYFGKKTIYEIPFSQNSIRFEYGIFAFLYENEVKYQYRLDQGEWSELTHSKIKEYSNLQEGNHIFEIKAVFTNGKTSFDSYEFIILPPWYQTTVAYVFYGILILLVLASFIYWDSARVKKKELKISLKKDKEIEEKEREFEKEKELKEQQIVKLEKEKLEFDLQHKSQEMANLLINFSRKNEILSEIKSSLSKIMSELKGEKSKEIRQMLLLVNNQIDTNIQSDDILNRIEEEFDLIHNNFMKRLQDKHPNLSVNERLMCAYIKMDLSSKEIAPLLNISIRGVETLRYRLRKKFDIEKGDSLSDYLDSAI